MFYCSVFQEGLRILHNFIQHLINKHSVYYLNFERTAVVTVDGKMYLILIILTDPRKIILV